MSAKPFVRVKLALALAILGAAGLLAYGIAQETPVGSLEGSVIARESGAPLQADVTLTSVAKVDGDSLYYSVKSREDGSFLLRNVATGAYKLDIQSKAHRMRATRILITEGATETLEADLEPDEPSLDLYIHQNVFTPGEAPQVTCHGFLDSDTINLRVYLVDPNAFLLQANASLNRLIGGSSYMSSEEQSVLRFDTNPSLKLAHQADVPITQRDVEGIFTQRVKLPVLAPGLYLTAIRSAGLQRVGWVMVTSLGLIAKTAGGQTLCYTVDLRTGDPIAAADVNLFLDSRQVASGRTDGKGIAHLSVPSGTTGRPDQMIVARSGDSFAFITAGFSSNPSTKRLIYAYTERPVYRPAQSVFYKGIVRNSVNDTYKTAARQPVVVEVRDPDDTLIYRGTKTTDRFGCYTGAVQLNSEAPTGRYSIRTSVDSESSESEAGFTVAAYRKPEFSVKATFDKKRYTRGEWVKARISVSYYFGSPVANADVSYQINRSAYWLFSDDEPMDEGYSDYGGYGEMVKYGDIRTDENGEATVEFPATWDQPKDNEGYDTDQQFSISLTATDKGGAAATGDQSVLVTRGEFAVEVQPDSYVTAPGKTVSVAIKAQDYDRHPMGDQDVSVTLNRETWSEDGDYNLEPLTTKQAATDKNGRAMVQLPVRRAGSMTITARTTDSRGNVIVSSAYIWSCGEAEGNQYSDPSFEGVDVVLDKKTYSAGDTAQVLILTNHPGLTALVTVEGSRIYDSRTVKLTGKSTLLSIPIKGAYKPNFYVSVCGVRNKQFLRKEVSAKVSIKSQALSIRIEPSKRIYKPAQKAAYKLKVTDSSGKPVSAELSLGVVDEAIYAIEPESTTPILDFFYARRENAVQTYDSFPQIYLSDPDKAGAPLQNEPMKIRVRKRFLDTAYWGPNIITDANGEAQVSFDLPDNLTTWRATVRGVTMDTLCGQATNTVIARQPMLVRLELPRFLVQGDKSVLTAVVHNYTGRDQRVKVSIRAPRLKVEDEREQTVLVKNDGSERIDWQVSAPKPGAFAVGVRAEGETAGDAVQLDLPVKPHGQESSTSTAAALSGSSKSISIPVRNDAILEATRLKVRLAPSLASSILGSLDYLAQYPYGCTEQTVSAFLPDVILLQSMKTLGLHNPKLEAQLPDMVHKGFARLYRLELSDGGWSWSQYGKSDPWMTAYVCYALIRAKEAGFPVKEDVMNRALKWLSDQVMSNRKLHLYPRAYGLYVLALGGWDVSTQLDALAARQKLGNETLAVLALAYQKRGLNDRAKAMLDRLFSKSISSGDGIHWSGGYRYDGGAIEPTALGLQAALRIAPTDPRVYDIVRWLMKSRRDDYWWSTRGTAMVLYAMSEFLKTTKELTPNETITVLVNGKVAGTVHFDKASVYAPQTEFTITAPDLRKGRNQVEIRKSGTGNVYYSTNLTQYIAKKTMPPMVSGAGLKVSRAYYMPSPNDNQGDMNAPGGNPITGCGTGETVLVRLTIYASASFRHMLLEDSIPAGCEIMSRGDVEFYDWYYWWSGQDIRDDKISFYLDYLGAGKHVIDYRMRAGFAGAYTALPAQVFSMYDPSIRATTGETEFGIR